MRDGARGIEKERERKRDMRVKVVGPNMYEVANKV